MPFSSCFLVGSGNPSAGASGVVGGRHTSTRVFGAAQPQSSALKGADSEHLGTTEESADTGGGNAAGWYSASFFNMGPAGNTKGNLNASTSNLSKSGPGVRRPRPHSSSEVVGAPPTGSSDAPNPRAPAGSFVGLAYSSLSADAMQMLNYPQRQMSGVQQQQQQQQARVSRGNVGGVAAGQNPGNALSENRLASAQPQPPLPPPPPPLVVRGVSEDEGASAVFVPGSLNNLKQQISGGTRRGSEVVGLEEYGYFMEEGFDASLRYVRPLPANRNSKAKHWGRQPGSPSPPAVVQPGPGGIDLLSTIRVPGVEEYPYSNTHGSQNHLASVGMTYADAGYDMGAMSHMNPQPTNSKSGQPSSTAATTQAKVRPLEPVRNDFFSAVNLRALRVHPGGNAVSSGRGNPETDGNATAAAAALLEDEDDVSSDCANRFNSSTTYNVSLGSGAATREAQDAGVKNHANHSSNKRRDSTDVLTSTVGAVAPLLDDEDDDWPIPMLSPTDVAHSPLGVGGTTARPPDVSGASKKHSKKEGAVRPLDEGSDEESTDFVMGMMSQVARGGDGDGDVPFGSVIPRLYASHATNSWNSSPDKHAGSGGRAKQGESRSRLETEGLGTAAGDLGGDVFLADALRRSVTVVGNDPDFPAISEATLRLKYRTVEATNEGAQDAITDILAELGASTHDASKSEQLRSLLAYFTSLQYSIKATD